VVWLSDTRAELDQAEQVLKNYRFTRGARRREMDEFFSRLPEPYKSFARYRYQGEGDQIYTIEMIAEKLGYAPRTLYVFRSKILKWWHQYSSAQDVQ
jgi:hypothetical protein